MFVKLQIDQYNIQVNIMYNDLIEWTNNSQVLNNPEAIAL